ncbi:MAG: DNA repair protein RecN, partial [Acidimicrobiales bacterium]
RYGDTLAEVRAYAEDARLRLEEMRGSEARAELLAAERDELAVLARRLEAEILRGRSEAAPRLAAAVEERLRELAMPGARLEVEVGDEAPGDAVTFLLAANPGEPALPLAKVASGGELSRAMLALRLVLAGAPPTAVFDEVDAGIGGEAAVTVGRALKELSRGRQVLVVTHLAQVAAFADQHFAVEKHEHGGRARSVVRGLHPEERTVELARMLAGQPGSRAAREHAEELLRLAAG